MVAVPPRADVRDCLIGPSGPMTIDRLALQAVVGTSSGRRAAQLRQVRPDLAVRPVRGNVHTRLQKVADGEAFDAVMLAAAGLERLGLHELAADPLSPDQILPAAGQGALAVQCRADDHDAIRLCLPLNDAPTAAAVHAERQVVAALGADCLSPVGVLGQTAEDQLELTARVLSLDGRTCLAAQAAGRADRTGRLVKELVKRLVDAGAYRILAESRAAQRPG